MQTTLYAALVSPGQWDIGFNHVLEVPVAQRYKLRSRLMAAALKPGLYHVNIDQALGLFWGKRTTIGDGTQANRLCAARKRLSIQLIAAIANTTLLGTNPSTCAGIQERSSRMPKQPQPVATLARLTASRACLMRSITVGDNTAFGRLASVQGWT